MTTDFGRDAEERSRGWFVYMSVRGVLYLDSDNVFCESPTRIGTFEEPSRFDERNPWHASCKRDLPPRMTVPKDVRICRNPLAPMNEDFIIGANDLRTNIGSAHAPSASVPSGGA
jgi:hypothetical protein